MRFQILKKYLYIFIPLWIFSFIWVLGCTGIITRNLKRLIYYSRSWLDRLSCHCIYIFSCYMLLTLFFNFILKTDLDQWCLLYLWCLLLLLTYNLFWTHILFYSLVTQIIIYRIWVTIFKINSLFHRYFWALSFYCRLAWQF